MLFIVQRKRKEYLYKETKNMRFWITNCMLVLLLRIER